MRCDGMGQIFRINYVKFCARPTDHSRGRRKLIFGGKTENNVLRDLFFRFQINGLVRLWGPFQNRVGGRVVSAFH